MRKTDPYSEIKRAPYALPKGVPALQEEPGRTRRWMLLATATALMGGVGMGYYAGRAPRPSLGPVGKNVDERRVAVELWVDELLAGPEKRIVDNGLGVLFWVEVYPEMPKLWQCVAILVDAATLDGSFDIQGVNLRSRIKQAIALQPGPVPETLRDRVRTWVDSPGRSRPR